MDKPSRLTDKINHKKSFAFTFINEASNNWKSSLLYAIMVQIISNLQITFLVLQYLSTQDNSHFLCLNLLRKISQFATDLDRLELLQSATIVTAIWCICVLYFAFHAGLILLLFAQYILKRRYLARFPCFTAKFYLMHSRIIFFPIHYFLLWYITEYNGYLNIKSYPLVKLKVVDLVVSIMICSLNAGITVFREFFCYQMGKSKDVFANKNNMHSKLFVIHKVSQLIFFFVITSSVQDLILVIINIIISIIYCWDLIIRLSFYNITILKLNACFAIAHGVLAIGLGVHYLGVWDNYLEVIMVVTIPLLIKIYHKITGQHMARITSLDIRTPEEAAHVPTLLKMYMNCNSTTIMSMFTAQRALLYRYGLLSQHSNEIKRIISKKSETFDDNQKVFMTFIRKCQALLRRYPKSELLQIIMAQVYINKIGNIGGGLGILTKLESSRISTPAQNSVKRLFHKLERTYSGSRSDKEKNLEVLKYFEKRNFGNKLKNNIQREVSEHLKLWKEISKETVEIKSVVEIAENIYEISKKVKRIWSTSFEDNNNFSSLVLMYGIYLEVIRGNHYERLAVTQKHNHNHAMKVHNNTSSKASPFSENVVVLLVSIEQEKLGRVVDASASVKNLFRIEKDRLIGQKLNNLMPLVVAKDHDRFIRKYSQFEYRNMYKEFTTYAKTIDGNFFEIDLEIRLCPSLTKGLNLMAQIRQNKGEELVIIADKKGMVIDCSTDLFQTFKISSKDFDSFTVMDLCPEFRVIHYSFNITHYGDKEVVYDPNEVTHERDIPNYTINKISDTPKGSKRLQSQASISAKIFSKLHTLALLEGENDFDKRVIPTIPTMITKEIAADLCQKFKDGIKMNYFPLRRDSSPLKTGDKLEFVTKVEPYKVNGKVYKMVRLKNFFMEQKILSMFKGGETLAAVPNQDRTLQKRLSNSPIIRRNKDRRSRREETGFDIVRRLFNFRRGDNSPGTLVGLDKTQEESTNLKPDSMNVSQKKSLTKLRNRAQAVSNHSKNSNQTGVQAIKTLNNLYDRQALRPVTKFSIFSVYFTTLVVFVLTAVDYFFSKKSIEDIQDGVDIINTANIRLIDTIVSWQWILIIYARSVGIRAVVPSFIESSKALLADRNAKMTQVNKDLKGKLEAIDKQEFSNIFFVKDIPLWQPSTGELLASDYVDSFTATKVLSTKYSQISRWSKSVLLLLNDEDLLFAVNNTANGLFIRSEEQIGQADHVLENIIEENQSLLLGLLILKITSLFLVLVSLVLLFRVIYLSYMRFFRALTKIKEVDITQRVAELELVSACLSEDIESRNLAEKLEFCFDVTDHHMKRLFTRDKKKPRPRFHGYKFSIKRLTIQTSKYLAVALVLLIVLTAVFSFSFYEYTSGFDTLQLLNSRISLANKLGYEFDMLLPTFYFFIIFENHPTYLLRNRDPELQFNVSIKLLNQANYMLLQSLSDGDKGLADSLVEDFFEHNLCNYISDSMTSSCEKSTKGKLLGFLELNAQYLDTHATWGNEYMKNKTYDNAKVGLSTYAAEVVNDVTIVEDSYHFLANHLLQSFNAAVDTRSSQSLTQFVVVLVSIFISAVIIKMMTIEKLRNDDLATKKILRVIPLRVIQENKILGAFLIGEYKKELQGIRRFLQNS